MLGRYRKEYTLRIGVVLPNVREDSGLEVDSTESWKQERQAGHQGSIFSPSRSCPYDSWSEILDRFQISCQSGGSIPVAP